MLALETTVRSLNFFHDYGGMVLWLMLYMPIQALFSTLPAVECLNWS